MSTVHLWLAPLLLGSIFGIISCLLVSLRWSVGYLIQHAIVAAIALAGFFTPYPWVMTFSGWIFFSIFNLGRRTMIGLIGNNLAALQTSAALQQTKWLKLLSWGTPGKAWYDLVAMLDFYAKEDIASAEQIEQKWSSFPLPPPMRDAFTSYALTGRVMNRDWETVLTRYNEAVSQYNEELKTKPGKARFPAQAAISACRAYCERAQLEQALQCLEAADIPANFHQKESLETIFMPFYSLTGARDDLSRLVQCMSTGVVPEFGRVYWFGRCSAARGEFQRAVTEYDKCISMLPPADKIWRKRVGFQRERTLIAAEASGESVLSVQQNIGDSAAANSSAHDSPGAAIMSGADSALDATNLPVHTSQPAATSMSSYPPQPLIVSRATPEQLERARALENRAMVVGEIMNASLRQPAVACLSVAITMIFTFSLGAQFLHNRLLEDLYGAIFTNGFLRYDLVASGQYWRFVTYLFLHANPSHLFMNLFGLIWLGKHVENIYGWQKFLIIYFGAGVFCGIPEILVTPSETVIGASGAVMGVFGASAAATLRLKDVLPPKIRKSELQWMGGLAAMQIVFDQIVNLLSSWHGNHDVVRIASWAHAGGMLAGFLVGYCLPLRVFQTKQTLDASTVQGQN